MLGFSGIFSSKVLIEVLGCGEGSRKVRVGVNYFCDIINIGSMHVRKHLYWCGYINILGKGGILQLFLGF